MSDYLQDEIKAERERQDAQWGGPAHDDQHDMGDWTDFIGKFTHRAWLASFSGFDGPPDVDKYEANLIRVAALAIAAVQSSRRKRQ